MKNIFLLSTDKETNLVRIWNDVERTNFTLKVNAEVNDSFKEYVNIYITNTEDLTLGGYHFNSKYGDEPQKTNQRDIDSRKYWEQEDYVISKIVLTNDTSLIEDGVQEVSSVFLSFSPKILLIIQKLCIILIFRKKINSQKKQKNL